MEDNLVVCEGFRGMHLYLKTEFQPAFRSEQINKCTVSSQHYFYMAVNTVAKRTLRQKLDIAFFHMQMWMIPQLCDEAKKSFEGLTQ